MSKNPTQAKVKTQDVNLEGASKARFFVPALGRELEGVDHADIERQVKKLRKTQEVGDADR